MHCCYTFERTYAWGTVAQLPTFLCHKATGIGFTDTGILYAWCCLLKNKHIKHDALQSCLSFFFFNHRKPQ